MSDTQILTIAGLVYLAVWISSLTEPSRMKNLIRSLSDNDALAFISGVFTAILGYLIVITHNVWAWQWTVVVTFIGWAALVKGLWLVAAPRSMLAFSKTFTSGKAMGTFLTWLLFVFGAGCLAIAYRLA
jgi:hypothetical protein